MVMASYSRWRLQPRHGQEKGLRARAESGFPLLESVFAWGDAGGGRARMTCGKGPRQRRSGGKPVDPEPLGADLKRNEQSEWRDSSTRP